MEDHEIAARAAKSFANNHGIEHRWREMWGAAWEGVERARREYGVTSVTELSRRAGFAIIDRFRRETQYRERVKLGVSTVQFSDVGDDDRLLSLSNLVPDHRAAEEPSTALGYWIGCKPLRRWASAQVNLMMYLYLVEGLLAKEVGDLFGVSESYVCLQLRGYGYGVDYARYCRGEYVIVPQYRNKPKKHETERPGDIVPLNDVIKAHVLDALESHSWNRIKTAKSLQVSVKTVYNWLREWGIDGTPSASRTSSPVTSQVSDHEQVHNDSTPRRTEDPQHEVAPTETPGQRDPGDREGVRAARVRRKGRGTREVGQRVG